LQIIEVMILKLSSLIKRNKKGVTMRDAEEG